MNVIKKDGDGTCQSLSVVLSPSVSQPVCLSPTLSGDDGCFSVMNKMILYSFSKSTC